MKKMTNSSPMKQMPVGTAKTNSFPVNTKHFPMLPGDLAIKGRATQKCVIDSDKGPTINSHQKANKAAQTARIMKGEPK